MTTQQFIKEHRFAKLNNKVLRHYIMHHPETHCYLVFNGDAQILNGWGINPTPQEINKIENLIITYLDDLYLSEFEEIKSMM